MNQKEIISRLVALLHSYEEGTDITTCQLLKAAGYSPEKFSIEELFDIHAAIFKAAKGEKLVLDMSAHEGKVEGLPFNLDFVVRKA